MLRLGDLVISVVDGVPDGHISCSHATRRALLGAIEKTSGGQCGQASEGPVGQYFGPGASGLLRKRAHDLRIEAAGLDTLADTLPANLGAVNAVADRVLTQMVGSTHRVYVGK